MLMQQKRVTPDLGLDDSGKAVEINLHFNAGSSRYWIDESGGSGILHFFNLNEFGLSILSTLRALFELVDNSQAIVIAPSHREIMDGRVVLLAQHFNALVRQGLVTISETGKITCSIESLRLETEIAIRIRIQELRRTANGKPLEPQDRPRVVNTALNNMRCRVPGGTMRGSFEDGDPGLVEQFDVALRSAGITQDEYAILNNGTQSPAYALAIEKLLLAYTNLRQQGVTHSQIAG